MIVCLGSKSYQLVFNCQIGIQRSYTNKQKHTHERIHIHTNTHTLFTNQVKSDIERRLYSDMSFQLNDSKV